MADPTFPRPPDSEADVLLEVRGLCTGFRSPQGMVPVVRDVSLTVRQGEVVGLLGESGSGKSLTARSILGLPGASAVVTAGEIRFQGRDLLRLRPLEMREIRGREIAFIPQDMMVALDPTMRVGEQITEVLRRGETRSKDAFRARAVELLDHVGVPEPQRVVDYYPSQLSGGMLQRAVIAMALSCGPSLLIADEPTTALDVTVQDQVIGLLDSLRRELGMAVLIISHNMGVVAGFADRVNVMYAGEVVESGPVDDVFTASRHPYTEALLRCVPTLDRGPVSALRPIAGSPPTFLDVPAGCPFHPRCIKRLSHCDHDVPPLYVGGSPGAEHATRCWLQAPEVRTEYDVAQASAGASGGTRAREAT